MYVCSFYLLCFNNIELYIPLPRFILHSLSKINLLSKRNNPFICLLKIMSIFPQYFFIFQCSPFNFLSLKNERNSIIFPQNQTTDARFMQVFFYMYKYIYFFNKKSLKWMILKKKFSQNIFAYSFVSENSKHFFLFEKKMAAGGGRGLPLPP